MQDDKPKLPTTDELLEYMHKIELGKHPEIVIERILGCTMWEKQVEILQSTWKYKQTWVHSANGTGKTHILPRIALAWMFCHSPELTGNPNATTIVAVFGPKFENLQKTFWHQMEDAWRNALYPLGGEMRKHDYYPWPDHHPRNFISIFSAKKESVENLQGHHAENLLIIIEEASRLDDEVLEALESLGTGANSRILAAGNPIKTVGPFYERCTDPKNDELKALRLRNVIKISALETPNYIQGREVFPGMVGRDWVDEKRRTYTEQSPFYQARVLGEFPQNADNAMFPLYAIEEACRKGDERELQPDARRAVTSFDVARQGDDKSVIVALHGDVVKGVRARHTPNLIIAADWYYASWMDWGGRAVIDENGLGGGPYDYLKQKKRVPVRGFIAQRKAKKASRFSDLKTETAWGLRERMIDGALSIPPSPYRDNMKADLAGYTFDYDGQGRLKLIDPPRSPDFGDALIMAHWGQVGRIGSGGMESGGNSIMGGIENEEF